jgi:DNA invertase Pin-like site-specific DNA recombinase
LGLAAQIEREFISMRTKEALTRRKESGLPMGRPKGRAPKVMLDPHREMIQSYLKKGVNKRSIAKIMLSDHSLQLDRERKRAEKTYFIIRG